MYEHQKKRGYLSEEDKQIVRFSEGLALEHANALNQWIERDDRVSRFRDSGSPAQKRLKRDIEREALTRIEESARTVDDFERVKAWWDRLDANRERKERFHEVCRDGDSVPLDYGAAYDGISFPNSLNTVLEKQIRSGDFLDAIFTCPYQIHELVTEEYLSRILRGLSDEHKELLFFRFVMAYGTKRLGAIREQTDRNIRKVTATMLKRIHKEMLPILTDRSQKDFPMTKEERQFLAEMKKFPLLRKRISDIFSNMVSPTDAMEDNDEKHI